MSALRMLPPVHKLLADPGVAKLIETLGHQVVAEGVRDVVEGLRKEFVEGLRQEITLEEAADLVLGHISRHEVPGIRTVINATGIILHTNLGRSPLAKSAAKAAYEAGRWYLNLEMDLDSGKRSSRQTPLRKLMTRLTGAESATVVNNCAAATILTLRVLAQGKEVILSRGQLIEIGGSFRMPDIMNASGAHLKEIGTTNITRIGDYEKAIGPNTGALMRVHTSNFKVVGFTKEASLAELVELGQKHNLPVIDDAGSGAIHDPSPYGLKGEPIPQEAIRLGAAVTLFSGDKLSEIQGNLTLKGITKPVTLTVTSFQAIPHPMAKKDAIGANAFTNIKRTDFNMGKYAPNVSDEVRIDIAIEAIKE